jgi:Xaa-Pro aminopeptidase
LSAGVSGGALHSIKIADKYEIPTFSKEEFKRRWLSLQQSMGSKNVDCLVIRDLFDLRYVSGVAGMMADACICLLPQRGNPSLIMPSGVMLGYAHEILPVPDLEIIEPAGMGSMDAMAAKLKALGLEKGTLGIDYISELSHSRYSQLQKKLPDANFVEAGSIFLASVRIKSFEEMEYCRKSLENGEKAFMAMVNTARPGVTMREVFGACMGSLATSGSDIDQGPLWGTAHWPSARPTGSAYPSFTGGSEHKLQKGDFIYMELYSAYAGYYSFVSEPIFMGKPPADFVRRFELNKGMLRISSELLRPGHTQRDIDDKVAEYLSSELGEKITNDIDEQGRPSLIDYKNMSPIAHRADKLLKEILPGEIIALAPLSFWDRGPNHLVSDTYHTTDGAPEKISKLPVQIYAV